MVECGCVIIHPTRGVNVRLCGAHSYGTDMLPMLRRFLQIFRELEAQYGPSLTAAYQDILHEAHVLVRQVEESQDEHRGARTVSAEEDIQSVTNIPQHSTSATRWERERTNKLA